jgi:pimeloyl-ACP methyl ester carboxylesterase
VWDYGGDGPPLVFCHCAGTLGRVWDPVIARFSRNARVLAPDFRGHGDSDKPRGARHYAWDRFGEDLLAVAKELGFGADAMAVGHSGGGVAVTLAQLARPGLFRRIALVDAIIAPAWFFPTINPMVEHARRRKSIFPSRDAARERLGGKPPYNAWASEALDAYVTHGFGDLPDGTVHLKCPGSIEAHFYETKPTENILDRMGEISVPALFLTGSASYMLEHVREQQRRTPGSRLEVLEEMGHFIPQEQPQRTAELLNAWFFPQA